MSLSIYVIESEDGLRIWQAEDAEHAIEQHKDAFPEDTFRGVSIAVKASSEYPAARAAS